MVTAARPELRAMVVTAPPGAPRRLVEQVALVAIQESQELLVPGVLPVSVVPAVRRVPTVLEVCP